MNLTDEEIRIKVAEAMGWTDIRYIGRGDDTICIGKPAIRPGGINVPDYPEDLNACAEFEKTLSSSECAAYRDFLHKNPMLYDDMVGACIDWQLVHATARQRCLAFLKTKGLIP